MHDAKFESGVRPNASVLVLLWGDPPRVLLVRKSCSRPSYWRCHAAFPGGHLEPGEDPVDAALREAWEEAWIYPGSVRVQGFLPLARTRIGGIFVLPVLAEPRGPLCYRPNSEEVDQVFWLPLSMLDREEVMVRVPGLERRVRGYLLPGGAVLWGLTLRIMKVLREYWLREEPRG